MDKRIIKRRLSYEIKLLVLHSGLWSVNNPSINDLSVYKFSYFYNHKVLWKSVKKFVESIRNYFLDFQESWKFSDLKLALRDLDRDADCSDLRTVIWNPEVK